MGIGERIKMRKSEKKGQKGYEVSKNFTMCSMNLNCDEFYDSF